MHTVTNGMLFPMNTVLLKGVRHESVPCSASFLFPDLVKPWYLGGFRTGLSLSILHTPTPKLPAQSAIVVTRALLTSPSETRTLPAGRAPAPRQRWRKAHLKSVRERRFEKQEDSALLLL